MYMGLATDSIQSTKAEPQVLIKKTAQATMFKNDAFRSLRLRLALAYIGIFSAILTIILLAVYQTIAYKLNQRLSDHVLSLTSSSAQALESVQGKHRKLLRDQVRMERRELRKQWEGECKQKHGEEWEEECKQTWKKAWRELPREEWGEWGEKGRGRGGKPRPLLEHWIFGEWEWGLLSLEADLTEEGGQEDLIPLAEFRLFLERANKSKEISNNESTEEVEEINLNSSGNKIIQRFRSTPQSVEWFDQDRKLLLKEGILEVEPLIADEIPVDGLIEVDARQLSFTLPVYLSSSEEDAKLIGFVRSTASREGIQKDLREIQLALVLGYIAALGLTVLCGNWLTTQALSPLAKNVGHLQQFTSDAAHELRTPLTVINGAIQLLSEGSGELSNEDAEKLNLITGASQEMKSLIDKLLLLARLDSSGTKGFDKWLAVPVDEILDDLVREYEMSAQEQQVKLEYSPFKHSPVMGDAEQLKQLFSNLIGNALQYTLPGGSVAISLCQKDDCVVVEVADTGIGLDPKDLPKIFDRFWRVDQARTRHTAGAGLGLSICRSVAYRHGGDIKVVSQIGVGSQFTVQLPLPKGLSES